MDECGFSLWVFLGGGVEDGREGRGRWGETYSTATARDSISFVACLMQLSLVSGGGIDLVIFNSLSLCSKSSWVGEMRRHGVGACGVRDVLVCILQPGSGAADAAVDGSNEKFFTVTGKLVVNGL